MAPPDRAPTMAQFGQAVLFGRACRIAAGNGETLEDLRAKAKAAGTASAAPAPASTSTSKKLKMNALALQVDDSEFDMAPEQDLMQCFRRCESIFGRGERPDQDQAPEQVSAIKCILARGSPPFMDFSVFGPHGHRIMKKVKLSGYNIGRDGPLQTIELYGLPNISMWEACYNVLGLPGGLPGILTCGVGWGGVCQRWCSCVPWYAAGVFMCTHGTLLVCHVQRCYAWGGVGWGVLTFVFICKHGTLLVCHVQRCFAWGGVGCVNVRFYM